MKRVRIKRQSVDRPWFKVQADRAEATSERNGKHVDPKALKARAKGKLSTKPKADEHEDADDDMPITTAMTGRPTAYRKSFAGRAKILCEYGATDIEVAEDLGVSEKTLYNWRLQFPEFLQALKRGKEVEDQRVEDALYNRASGVDRSPGFDTTANIFWLKNRRRDVYNRSERDSPTINQLFVNIDPSKLQDLKPEQLKTLELAIRKLVPKGSAALQPQIIDHGEPLPRFDEQTPGAELYEDTLR